MLLEFAWSREIFIIDSVNEKRTKASCQCYVLQPAIACCTGHRLLGRIVFIWFMNRTAAVELAVRGGVTRRDDRYSWKGSTSRV
jgi:hypothetical protein